MGDISRCQCCRILYPYALKDDMCTLCDYGYHIGECGR